MPDYQRTVMEKLFTAKWNVPKAAVALGLGNTEVGWAETKKMFADYCVGREMRYID